MEPVKRVLIVEDEKNIADALSVKLRSRGINVTIANDGEEGLKLALSRKPNLLVLDLILPRLDGMSLLRQIRQDEWGKSVPVMILSNLGTGDELEKAKELGVSDFLIKTDWKLESVVDKIDSLLA